MLDIIEQATPLTPIQARLQQQAKNFQDAALFHGEMLDRLDCLAAIHTQMLDPIAKAEQRKVTDLIQQQPRRARLGSDRCAAKAY